MLRTELISLAIEKSPPDAFERFCQVFAGSSGSAKFLPLGGMHDGGADGYFETESETTSFVQITKQIGTKDKIRSTIERLREYGRNVNKLTLYTSQTIVDSDKLREWTFDRYGVYLSTRDLNYLCQNTNNYPSAILAAKEYLLPSLDYLKDLTNNDTAPKNVLSNRRELSVFLTQEIERRRNTNTLADSVCDSLILWALEGTDPDQQIFLTKEGIIDKVKDQLPTAENLIKGRLEARLNALKRKGNDSRREINYHPSTGYCLPYDTRCLIEEQNISDNIEEHQFETALRERIMLMLPDGSDEDVLNTVRICKNALHKMFEYQGLEISCFISGNDPGAELNITVQDCIEESMESLVLVSSELRHTSIDVCRKLFYESTDIEREYLARLSRTYMMLFALQAEPKIAEYFSKMSSKLLLYVGADIIIRAISEYFISPDDQATTNLLNIMNECGAKLILTEKTLEEIWTHMRSDLLHFENEYSQAERHFDIESAKHFPRILMRSYMYCRLGEILPSKDRPKSFGDYLNKFVDISDLRNSRSPDSLQGFIMKTYNMKFERAAEMERGIESDDVDNLASIILAEKGKAASKSQNILARNDALQVLRVYERRHVENDNSPDNPYGFSVWWLTQETSVVRATKYLVSNNGGRKYLMRPEFLLGYVSYAPKLAQIRERFQTVFPSKLGVRLSHRAKKDVFNQTVKTAIQLAGMDDVRADFTIRKLTNELKGSVSAPVDFEPVR